MRRPKLTIERPLVWVGHGWYAGGKFFEDLGDAYDRAVFVALRDAPDDVPGVSADDVEYFGVCTDDESLRDRLSSWLQWFDSREGK